MNNWEKGLLDYLNGSRFRIEDGGPLHTPVKSFSIRRTEKFRLLLETHTTTDAKSQAIDHQPGTLRVNNDAVHLINALGNQASLIGVQPTSYNASEDYATGDSKAVEISQVDHIVASLGDRSPVEYSINWIENFPSDTYTWPNVVKTKVDIATSISIGNLESCLDIKTFDGHSSTDLCAARIIVRGRAIYICAIRPDPLIGQRKPGCIIYEGEPDEEFQRQFVNSLSFSLGAFLIQLGTTTYTADWQPVSFKSISPYTMNERAFDLLVFPPAPLGLRWQNEIAENQLTRLVNAILDFYAALNFADLSWAYWHALATTMHISAVHFGAAIEILQRRYEASHPSVVSSKVLPGKAWRDFKADITRVISGLAESDGVKAELLANVGQLNRTHQKKIREAILQEIGINLSLSETKAWTRRDNAAHGMEMVGNDVVEIIKETKLLQGLFHRMILRMTDASDFYIDYATVGFPLRKIQDPPSE